MNEFLRKFIMDTVIEMIEKKVAEWQVRKYALDWYSKGLLTETDLAVIEEKYTVKEEPVEEEVESTEVVETVETTEEPTDTNVGTIEEEVVE